MLVFSRSKINLGLNIIEKRSDGFHNIETVFYPISWSDAIEALESADNQPFKMYFSGLNIVGQENENIISKAYHLLKKHHSVPGIKVHLYKHIPMGAGLGGGSSNAVNFIELMDKKFDLKIPLSKKIEYAKELGSDCAFFVKNEPVFAKGKGDIFEHIKVDLDNYFILIVYPNVHSNTKLAYDGVVPKKPQQNIKTIIETRSIEQWKDLLKNDFEDSVFKNLPQIKELKEKMYLNGAIYASMSGSGSAVFGIFKTEPKFDLGNFPYFLQQPLLKTVK
jgi:4-diphosphocytidyl-2-C-methyl-D-erythritol kinase